MKSMIMQKVTTLQLHEDETSINPLRPLTQNKQYGSELE